MNLRRFFSIILAISLAMALFSGCANDNAPGTTPANSTPGGSPTSEEIKVEYTFKMAHTHSGESLGGIMMQKMADLIKEHTNGRIEVEVYPAGQLGDKLANLEGLRAGTIDITQCAATDISSFNDRWSVFSLPFMFASVEEAQKAFLDEEFQAVLEKDLNEVGFSLLGMENAGSRSVINKVRPINEPSDCVGLKVRSLQDVYIARGFELCGFGVVALGWTEVYSALQQGVVDGADNSAPYIYDAKFQELCDYFSITEMIRQPGTIMISYNTYNNLPDDLKAAVDAAGAEWEKWQWNYYEEYDAEALKKLEEAGVQINTITPENRQKFVDATKPVYDEFFKAVPAGRELYDLMMAAVAK